MKSRKQNAPTIADLADRISEDIRRRKLQPGDPYLSTAETAQMLGVSGTTANRALQLLSQRRVLERRQRRGAYIADPTAAMAESRIGRVHLLVHRRFFETEGILADGVVMGIQGELPGANFEFNFIPAMEDADFINQLIADALRATLPEGFVLVRSSLIAQRLLQTSGLPMVIYGTPQPSIQNVAQVERDQSQIGSILAKRLLSQGCKQIAVFLRDAVTPGEHLLLDAVINEMKTVGLGVESLSLRCLATDNLAIKAAAKQLLATAPKSLGLLCRSELLAQGAAEAAEELGLTGKKRPPIVICDVFRKDGAEPAFPYIRTIVEPIEIGRSIGRMLVQQARSEPPNPLQVMVPVALKIPGEGIR